MESFVTTKIRPIRKIFLLEKDDYDNFLSILKILSTEIDGYNNLLIISDIFERRDVIEMVNRFDPDVAINYSNLDDSTISNSLNVLTYNSKSENFNLAKFGSPLFSFTGKPFLTTKDPELVTNKCYASFEMLKNPQSLFYCLNYGYAGEKQDVDFKNGPSIFKGVDLFNIKNESIEEVANSIFKKNLKYSNITNEIGSAYHSSGSIYDISYKSDTDFNDGEYIFIGKSQNLEFLTYFWNIKAFYNMANFVWVPEEILEITNNFLTNDSVIICPTCEDKDRLSKNLNNKFIIADQFYFHGGNERWINFEYDQYCQNITENVTLTHPNEKTFSDIGFGGGYAFEVQGLAQLSYPKNYFLGNLYQEENHNSTMFPEYFTRITNRGLAKYFLHFNPYETSGITQTFRIPKFEELVKNHFSHYGLEIRPTSKTHIFEHVKNILKNDEGLNLICEDKIFHLLISLTPHVRTERLIKKAFPDLDLTPIQDDMISHIGRLKETGEINIEPTTLNLDGIFGKLELKKDLREKFIPKIQALYDRKILLRGKKFTCEHCTANIWLPLDSLRRINHCMECDNEIHIPVAIENRDQGDHFKLNKLVERAVDQGQLSTLLLFNYLNKQATNSIQYLSNYEIFKDNNLTSDIDLFIKIGSKLGLCESKTNSGFDNRQIIEILEVANTLKVDFILLSCLVKRDDPKIIQATTYINQLKPSLPVFILSEEELFSTTPERLYDYFQVNFHSNAFSEGAIILGK